MPHVEPTIPANAQALTSSHLLRTMQAAAMRTACPGIEPGQWCGYPRTVLGGHYTLYIAWASQALYAQVPTTCLVGHELPLCVVVLEPSGCRR